MKKIKVGKKNNIREEKYTSDNIDEINDKPTRKTECIILRKNKGCKKLFVKGNDFFDEGNYYYIDNSGVYVTNRGNRVVVFMEGVTLPISHSDLEYEMKEFKYFDPLTGRIKKEKVKTVKGIKFDSKLFSNIVDGKLIDVITKSNTDTKSIITIILLIITAGASIVSAVLSYIGGVS